LLVVVQVVEVDLRHNMVAVEVVLVVLEQELVMQSLQETHIQLQ